MIDCSDSITTIQFFIDFNGGPYGKVGHNIFSAYTYAMDPERQKGREGAL